MLKKKKSKYKLEKVGVLNIVIFALLVVYVLSLLLLCIWGIFTSLKSRNEFYTNKVWCPSGSISEWEWANFSFVFKNFVIDIVDQYGRKVRVSMFNQFTYTLMYAGGGALIATFCCCWVSYLVAKFK